MASKASHLLVFLLGLSVAVGFYEGRRLVVNTGRAMTVASAGGVRGAAQSVGKDDPTRKRVAEKDKPGRRQAPARQQKAREKAGSPPPRPVQQQKRPARQGQELTAEERQLVEARRARTERRQRRLQAWQQLSEEEKAKVRERRRERRAGGVRQLNPGKGGVRQLAPGMGGAPLEKSLSARPLPDAGEDLLVDTGLTE